MEKCLDSIQHQRIRTIDIIPLNPGHRGSINKIHLTPNGQISEIRYRLDTDDFKDILDDEKIEHIIVKLEHPFKPYTVISCPFGPCGKYIVADINNETVKTKVEEWKKMNLERTASWLGVDIPVYHFPNGWESGDSIYDPVCLSNLPIAIEDLHEAEDLNAWEQEFVNCVKSKQL